MSNDWPAAPATPVRDVHVLTNGIWLWSWLPPVFPSSTKVRPADMDGWVEQGGQLLMLDGAVGSAARSFKPSAAIVRAVKQAKNITYLALLTDEQGYDPETHLPLYITHYYLRVPKGGWQPPSFQWNRWQRLPADESLWHVTAIVAQWAAWAHYQSGVSPSR